MLTKPGKQNRPDIIAIGIICASWLVYLFYTGESYLELNPNNNRILLLDQMMAEGGVTKAWDFISGLWLKRRFQPIYWYLYLGKIISFQFNYSLYTYFAIFQGLLTTLFFYFGARKLNFSVLNSFIFCSLIVWGPQVDVWREAFYAETPGLLFLSISFFFFSHGLKTQQKLHQTWLSHLFLIFAMITKESFILVAPAYVFIQCYFVKRKFELNLLETWKKTWVHSLSMATICGLILLWIKLTRVGVEYDYFKNPNISIKERIGTYLFVGDWWYFLFLLIPLVIYPFRKKVMNKVLIGFTGLLASIPLIFYGTGLTASGIKRFFTVHVQRTRQDYNIHYGQFSDALRKLELNQDWFLLIILLGCIYYLYKKIGKDFEFKRVIPGDAGYIFAFFLIGLAPQIIVHFGPGIRGSLVRYTVPAIVVFSFTHLYILNYFKSNRPFEGSLYVGKVLSFLMLFGLSVKYVSSLRYAKFYQISNFENRDLTEELNKCAGPDTPVLVLADLNTQAVQLSPIELHIKHAHKKGDVSFYHVSLRDIKSERAKKHYSDHISRSKQRHKTTDTPEKYNCVLALRNTFQRLVTGSGDIFYSKNWFREELYEIKRFGSTAFLKKNGD